MPARKNRPGKGEDQTWRPGDRARIRFGDGHWRTAELTRGFVWISIDGQHRVNACGGFDVKPLLRSILPDSAGEA